jgi:phosphoglycerate kinase
MNRINNKVKKLTIDQVNLKDKIVLVRVDFNVPLDEHLNITNDMRIKASLPTINKIVSEGGKAILMSHLGRPKGERNLKFSLKPVAVRLQELLNTEVKFVDDCVGSDVDAAVDLMKPGDVLLLENVRFHAGETMNDKAFSKLLAKWGDVYIDDAFGSAHRAHASTEGVTKFIDISAAGYLMKKELEYLGTALSSPERPYCAVLGGAKISGKIDVIKNLINKVDTLIIGGGMAFTFFKAQGKEIGKSLLEEEKLNMAKDLLHQLVNSKTKFLLPIDVVVAEEFKNDSPSEIVSVNNIPVNKMGLDIGPETIKLFTDELLKSKTVVWNGPMGVFEMDNFSRGTFSVAQTLAEITGKGAVTVVGGGDSAAAISLAGLENRVSHVSTGGGASLEFLEGKVLPGVEALNDI